MAKWLMDFFALKWIPDVWNLRVSEEDARRLTPEKVEALRKLHRRLENRLLMSGIAAFFGVLQLCLSHALLSQYYSVVPAKIVRRTHDVSTRTSHHCHVVFKDETHKDIDFTNLPRECPPPGTLVEKRNREFVYRFDGTPGQWSELETNLLYLVLGSFWLLLGSILFWNVRVMKKRLDKGQPSQEAV